MYRIFSRFTIFATYNFSSMIYLLIAVLCGASLSIFFKIFGKTGVDSLQGIFFNYLTAICVSLFLSGSSDMGLGESLLAALSSDWAAYAIFTGLLFMGGILVLAMSTQRSGVALTNIAARASMIIPVVAGWLLLGEQSPKWVFIALVLVAMVMIFGKFGEKDKISPAQTVLPLCVLLLFGLNDFMLKFTKSRLGNFKEGNAMLFIFSTAAVFCVLTYLVRGHYSQHKFDWRAIPGGILLGLANSSCTAMMLKALGVMDGVVFFPLYNVGVVCVTLLVGTLVFREKLKVLQIAGIVLAAASIVFIFISE